MIQTLLNQSVFAALLMLAGAVVILSRKRLHASLALLFFVAGYFVTQIPLVSDMAISRNEKYLAQGIISLLLITVYYSLDVTLPLLIALGNEVILIAVNIAFLFGGWHEWYHWAIFGSINYISFAALCFNWGRKCGVVIGGIHPTGEAGRMPNRWFVYGLQESSGMADKT